MLFQKVKDSSKIFSIRDKNSLLNFLRLRSLLMMNLKQQGLDALDVKSEVLHGKGYILILNRLEDRQVFFDGGFDSSLDLCRRDH